MANLVQVPPLKTVGVEDEDPLGEKSSGMLSTKPNTKLRKAAKKGDISDARAAVAEGADVRHVESGETAYDVAIFVYRENVNRSGKDWKETQKYRSLASNTKEVADYLVNVATAKMQEAIMQGDEGRVRAFHVAHGMIDSGNVVALAATSSDSVALMDYLVNNSQTNFQQLWAIDGNQSVMEKAKSKNHHAVAAYIEGRLSHHFSNVILHNDLSLLRTLHRAGALVDFIGCNNMVVGISTGNVEIVKFLFEHGCRVEENMYAQATPQIQFYLKYACKGRQLRNAASKGDLAGIRTFHAQGGDLNARNCYGATALSMCIQHGPFISCIHYLVSRGASLLHNDTRCAPSLIQYAKSIGGPYELVRSYLARELNIEFLEAVVENDMGTCEALGRLGADFNYQDRHGRTCLHLATKYQGVDTIQWLVERGCLPTTPDSLGEYAITLAATKGDYAAVKYLTTHNAGTKNLTNQEGLNALQIAKKYRYNHIVQLLEPGNKDYPVDQNETACGEPKYDIDTLVRASRNGHLSVVQEFIDERYASLTLKTEHCKTMLQEATRKQQSQIVNILKAHYASLTSQVASDQTADRLVGASAQQKAILQGLLNGLAGLLSGSEIELDPNDPNTYTQLFTNLSQNVQQRGSELSKLHSPVDIQRQVASDNKQLEMKLAKIQQDMEQMNKSKQNLEKRLQATEAHLKVAKNALEKKDTFKELEAVRGEMAALACSVSLITSIQESTEAKRRVLASIKQETSLYYFYSTIENRLQSLLVACATSSTGMFTQQQSNSVTVLQLAGKAVSIVPVIGQAVQKLLFAPVTALVAKLDKIKQAQEVRNIQALGNIEEMNRAASNAAGLMTLYYSGQITNIDLSNTVSSSSNNKIVLLAKGAVSPGEVKIGMDTISTAQHTNTNNGVVKFAEFAVYWVIKYLKSGQIIPQMPLAEQLWFAVASHNPYASKSVTDKLGKGAGSTKVTLKSGKSVEIRMLYAGVQVVTNDGSVYRPKGVILNESDSGSSEIGYVHVNAFATKPMSDAIIQNRNLYKEEHAKYNPMNETLSKQVQVFRSNIETSTEIHGSSATPGIGFEQQKIASTVGDYLKKSGDMIGEQQVKDLVKQTFAEAEASLECEVDVLREELKQKTEYYQTSIDAATETITKEIGECKAENKSLQQQQKAYSEEHIKKLTSLHQQAINDMNKEHASALAEREKAYKTLHATLQSQLQQIQANAEQQLKSVTDKYQHMIEKLSEELTAVTKASESKAAAAEKTASEARSTCERVMESCTKQKQEWDDQRKIMIETHQKLIQEQTTEFQSVTSTTKAALKEQSNVAKEAAEQAKVLAKNAKEEVAIAQKLAKEEAGRAKEAVNAAERAASAAKDAMSQAKKAQESATSALDKVNKRTSTS